MAEGKTYLYPDRLVPRLKDAWRRSRQTPKEILPDFPPAEVVQRLLDTCYHASFMTEESREVVFHVVLCDRVQIERDCEDSWRRYNRLSPVVFSSPRVFNETELLRLSPATDPNRVFIGVEIDESFGQAPENSLAIWGIIDAGSSWWDFVHGESKYGYPPPDFLTISTNEFSGACSSDSSSSTPIKTLLGSVAGDNRNSSVSLKTRGDKNTTGESRL